MIMVAPGSLSEGFTMSVLPGNSLALVLEAVGGDLPVTVASAADHRTILGNQLYLRRNDELTLQEN